MILFMALAVSNLTKGLFETFLGIYLKSSEQSFIGFRMSSEQRKKNIMPKILHHRQKCIACGACAAVCPKFFEMSEKDGLSDLKKAKYDAQKKQGKLAVSEVGCAQDAQNSCPVQAIEIK